MTSRAPVVDYGRDTSCTTGLRSGRVVSGLRLLAEAAFRRITTPRGSLQGGEDEADYGIDIFELIGSVESESDAKAMAGRIELELRKDDRFQRVDVQVFLAEDGGAIEAEVQISILAAAGPFSFVVPVGEVEPELVGFKEAA